MKEVIYYNISNKREKTATLKCINLKVNDIWVGARSH